MPSVYLCPRCNYSTIQKNSITLHFYSRKKACPNENNLELTEEIKQTVLRDHKYHPPPVLASVIVPQSTIQIINNQQNVMNIIGTLDVCDKISMFLEYKGKSMQDFDRNLWRPEIDDELGKIKSGYYNFHQIETSDILTLVDNITLVKIDETEKMNILFDKKLKIIRLFMHKKWDVHSVDKGIIELIRIIKEQYLDSYELYLIKKIYDYDVIIKNDEKRYETFFFDYLQFLAKIDLPPYICELGESDMDLVGRRAHDKNTHYIIDHYGQVFENFKKEIKKTQITELKSELLNIIKRNTIQNLATLDKELMTTIRIDEEFRNRLLGA